MNSLTLVPRFLVWGLTLSLGILLAGAGSIGGYAAAHTACTHAGQSTTCVYQTGTP